MGVDRRSSILRVIRTNMLEMHIGALLKNEDVKKFGFILPIFGGETSALRVDLPQPQTVELEAVARPRQLLDIVCPPYAYSTSQRESTTQRGVGRAVIDRPTSNEPRSCRSEARRRRREGRRVLQAIPEETTPGAPPRRARASTGAERRVPRAADRRRPLRGWANLKKVTRRSSEQKVMHSATTKD